ncbi:hypothetical protein [Methylobacterium sp. CM6247]
MSLENSESPELARALQRVASLSDTLERFKDERNELKEEIANLKRSKNTSETLDKLIEPYARRTYWFMVGYCSFVGLMLFSSAQVGSDVHIDNDVMKILVGSTAVTVIGLVGMILTGVFVGARKS